MRAIVLAFRVFFRTLFDRAVRERVDELLQQQALTEKRGEPETALPPPPKAARPAAARRSEALTLLAALQREARLVDFLQEPIDGYDDAQIGAAVRDIHRDCAAVLERMFALRPVMDQAEGSSLEVPPGFDAARLTLTGSVRGEPPFRGTLVHPGWQATRCELPEWTGLAAAALIVAPAEVEVR